MKQCSKCKKYKPDDKFFKRAGRECGLRSHCRKCLSEYNRKRNSLPDVKLKASNRQKQYIKQNGEKIKNAKLMTRYGISIEEYKQKLDSQDKKCAICKTNLEMEKRTHLDHDHNTGKIRGILCWNCNGGLGNFSDDIERLKSAINYLKGWIE